MICTKTYDDPSTSAAEVGDHESIGSEGGIAC